MPGIGLFFMVSGALLLKNNLSQADFLKKRFTKILWPTLFWTFFYLIFGQIKNDFDFSSFIQSIISIPFSPQGHGVLWFMYTLSGLYLLTPIISKWLQDASKHEIEFYLLLWGCSLILPYLSYVGLKTSDTYENLFYYFSGYLGYYVLGYYLQHKYKPRLWHFILALTISVSVPACLYGLRCEFEFKKLFWYLTLPIACFSFCYWFLLKRTKIKKGFKAISTISTLCFGVYLLHIFIMRDILWKISTLQSINSIISIPVIALATFLLSLLVVYFIKKLPFSKYIIGV